MSKTVLVFDFGAYRADATLCSVQSGKLSLEKIHSFPNLPVAEDGHLRWDTDELWEQVRIAISFGVFNGGFDAISIDAWGADFGLIGQDGELMEKPVHFRDIRTVGMLEEVCARIPARELFFQSGVQPSRINTLFQLNYLVNHERSSVFRAEKLLMIPDLFAYFLTGNTKNEYTEAVTTQLINHETRGWNIRLIENLGIPKRIFSPLIQPGEIYGMMKQELADEFRIEPVPIYACPSDIAAAALSVPSQEEHSAFVHCGDWVQLGTVLRRPIVTEQALNLGFTNEGCSGGMTALLKIITKPGLIQKTILSDGEQPDDGYSTDNLEKAARETEPFPGFIDFRALEFASPEDIRQKIQEYCRSTGQKIPNSPGEIMLCIVRSLACEFALSLRELSRLTGTKYSRLYITGGGTECHVLCQFAADAAGIPVTAGPDKSSVIGNAISSLISMGEIADISAAKQMIRDSGLTEEYQPQQHEQWIQPTERYRALTRQQT